jgi:hypothetical protein
LSRTSVLETLDELGDSGALLADGDVDAEELLLVVVAVVETLLVDDGVDGNGGLAGLTIADDKLTLATTNGHEGVDGLETSLHALVHGLAGNNTGSLDTDTLAGDVAAQGALQKVIEYQHERQVTSASQGNGGSDERYRCDDITYI